jgi:hypothetical protein
LTCLQRSPGNARANTLKELTDLYGQPTHQQDQWTYRWEIKPLGKMNQIHLCLSADEASRRAVIWVFDPSAQPLYLNLNGEADLATVLAKIKRYVPCVSMDGSDSAAAT